MEDSLTATAYVLAPDATKQKTIAAEVRIGTSDIPADRLNNDHTSKATLRPTETNTEIGLETNTIKLSAVILSMQDLLFSNDAKQRETGMLDLYHVLGTHS